MVELFILSVVHNLSVKFILLALHNQAVRYQVKNAFPYMPVCMVNRLESLSDELHYKILLARDDETATLQDGLTDDNFAIRELFDHGRDQRRYLFGMLLEIE